MAAEGGDILRGVGGTSPSAANPSQASSAGTPASATQLQANSQNILAGTTRTLQALQAMESAARAAALQAGANNLGANPNKPGTQLPNVPDGLTDNRPAGGAGGLIPDSGLSAAGVANLVTTWQNASTPTQSVANGQTTVTIKQTAQQALLNWQTFNVGKNTTVTFDQTGGGANSSQWIAFNQVSDPSVNPTQILGTIQAAGQVYIINQNGVIFGGGSQVNTNTLTVTSLPINTNLLASGLLNNPDAQFLFSALSVPVFTSGNTAFVPGAPPATASGHYGNVTVQAGAELTSPVDSAGNGGRVMLVGANVTNNGTISTESGQTVLAAGLQVGIAAHNSNDPSLRGLDVWVGAVDTSYAGTATNNGLIQTLTGSTSITGSAVNQLGVIDSSSSVTLNGRIDLNASYGAVANPDYLRSNVNATGGPEFFNQYTGVVTLGQNSLTRILPDYASTATIPGTALPERSQANITGLAIDFQPASVLLAPNGLVTIQAGDWPYKDTSGTRTIYNAGGTAEQSNINSYFNSSTQQFYFDAGQIYVDQSAIINVAGSANVEIPLTDDILNIRLLGPELANSPLQQASAIRGATLTVDIRNTGTYNGQYWVGTPLGDVTGLANIIQYNAAQLTVAGGNISLQSGGSIVVRNGATLDVSGGYLSHDGGTVQTSMLITSDGRLVDIKNATPDQVYVGVTTSQATYEAPYIDGAAGGSLSLTAPGMALDGTLRGATAQGPRQLSAPPVPGSLSIDFEGQETVTTGVINYINWSPTPPAIQFVTSYDGGTVPDFTLTNNAPAALPANRLASVTLPATLLSDGGFGSLTVLNPDGQTTLPAGVTLATAAGGSITLTAANLTILGSVLAPGGSLSFTTYDTSPSLASYYNLVNSASQDYPAPTAGRGLFTLGGGALLSAAGLITDDSVAGASPDTTPIQPGGGSIGIKTYSAALAANSTIDVSGGVYVPAKGSLTYGKGGSISISTGTDPDLSGVLGGTISLASTLEGYSGTTGGSLAIQAGLIDVGSTGNTGALLLPGGFFSQGGFAKFSLTGIGAESTPTPPSSSQAPSYIPAIVIEPGAQINAAAESLLAEKDPTQGGATILTPFLNVPGLRSPVSLSFTATGVNDSYYLNFLKVRGDIVMDAGTSITTDPGASVSFNGQTVTLLGSVTAPGGSITVTGASSFPFTAQQNANITQALPTVFLGSAAALSVAGTVQLLPDAYGRQVGTVYPGGTITLSGNILAQQGSLLAANGASGTLDLPPASVASAVNVVNYTASGLTSAELDVPGVPTRVDSNGGTISLLGSQMLLADSTLQGAAGGPTATGGQLVVSCGRFYPAQASGTNADINLVVVQSGNVILNPSAPQGVGIGLFDASGNAYGNDGTFALDRFSAGGFASLSLGGLAGLDPKGSNFPYGGNIQFQGKIDLQMSGPLILAAGGVISANNTIDITASYIAVGQPYAAPLNPSDSYVPFQHYPAPSNPVYNFAPTHGSGSLTLHAGLIDVGTLSLQNIGTAVLTSSGGDIRGYGTLDIAGSLTLNAAQVYPTSLASFSIYAYNYTGGTGSVAINSSGQGAVPLSAGGTLSIYASSILQNGVLRAPLGSIQLGWDGTDGSAPVDPIAGSTIAAPVSSQIVLGNGSLTSVSAATASGSPELVVPFGISPDGQNWINPVGINVTLSGLPEKSVAISGTSVTMASGAMVDLRGGGDLLASEWLSGNGGTINLLQAPTAWVAGESVQAGALVTYGGNIWSARVANTGVTPSISTYWTEVPQSYAILPSSSLLAAPYNAYNTGSNASALDGNPGFVSTGLSVGETVTLDASAGLPAGTYTLLPASYALLSGAYLITPLGGTGIGTITTPLGALQVSGYLGNNFNQPAQTPPTVSRFQISPPSVVQKLVSYATFSANSFLSAAAASSSATTVQQLPQDGGYAVFNGSSALSLAGQVLTPSPGLGSAVDISSYANICLAGGSDASAGTGSAVLQTSLLSSWGVDSLIIGGVRSQNIDGTWSLNVRSANVTLENPGGNLSAGDVVLASTGTLTLAAGSSVTASGTSTDAPENLSLSGDGTLLRVSAGSSVSTTRGGYDSSTAPEMTIGNGVKLQGQTVILDSTYGTSLSPAATLAASRIVLSGGQISVVFANASGALAGAVVTPQLALQGATLASVLQAQDLTLQSYGSIDFYGTGTLGGSAMAQLNLVAGGLRGYQQAAGSVALDATEVTFINSLNASALPAPAANTGTLAVNASTILLGANTFSAAGYQNLSLNASGGILVQGQGTFSTVGNLQVTTPIVTGEADASYTITAGQAMVLNPAASGGTAPAANALGTSLTLQATTVTANSNIILPSGQLTVLASGGDITVGGNLSVAGASTTFDGTTEYSNAGSITLNSPTGNVTLAGGGSLSVAAATGGGNAGTLSVLAPLGSFSVSGSLYGQAPQGSTSGAFSLDTGSLAATGANSFATINTALQAGGFFASRDFRMRNGDVTISQTIQSQEFTLSTDQGSISVTGEINASGTTGGSITLAARGNLTIASGATLTVEGKQFNDAGEGGSILLEAGSEENGTANENALLTLQQGATINLAVDAYVPGGYATPGSSAFNGQFTGTLHLRAPRTAGNNNLLIAPIQSTIAGASSVVAEGFNVYVPGGGVLNITLRNQINSDNLAFLGAAGTGNANDVAISNKLLSGAQTGLASLLVIEPGVEIVNPNGDLTLGASNNATGGTTNAEALAGADWDMSSYRYGLDSAPGTLTLRASGNLVFNNTLSDGFKPTTALNGGSYMWLATLMPIVNSLPVNTQDWSFNLTAGADTSAANTANVLPLGKLAPSGGSVLVGQFYPAVPNPQTSGSAAAIGSAGTTANSLAISSSTNKGTRYQVIRTGTGDIAINAGRDVQLRNQFATIYTAGVALPTPTTIDNTNDFVVPVEPTSSSKYPTLTGTGNSLGAVQQLTQPVWSMAGGNVTIAAQGNIGRYTQINGALTVDSSRQMPTDWLYRRGYVDPSTNLFANNGGVNASSALAGNGITDAATSTTWWIDFSNFFEGVGALGGGNVSLSAGQNIINVDAVTPTNARMPGRELNPAYGVVAGAPQYLNLAPNASKLLELGGGDVTVKAGGNISGGVYYVERGTGVLSAGGSITTNSARSPSPGILNGSAPLNPLTWLPITLFVGDSTFDVTAVGNILLGPVSNPFLMPEGLNNGYWYKTEFSTYAPDSGINVASYGGSVTFRTDIATPGTVSAAPLLADWYSSQNLYTGGTSAASYYQPWLRLDELSLASYGALFNLEAPNLQATAFGGDINLQGSFTLAPSATGNLQLLAAGSINGLQDAGTGAVSSGTVQVWTSSTINVSDASPASIPGIANPLAYQSQAGRGFSAGVPVALESSINTLQNVNLSLQETGSYSGLEGAAAIQDALHDPGLLHANDATPVLLYATNGDISGLTLFSPKETRIVASQDITDVSFYLQNDSVSNISLVSAGRNIIPFDEGAPLLTLANNLAAGNVVDATAMHTTDAGNSTNALAGDIQINGPGVLEVLGGRNLDLGNGASFPDGTGAGISSIGNSRDPYLPFAGADIVALAGVSGPGGLGPALGLAESSMNIAAFLAQYLPQPADFDSAYMDKFGSGLSFGNLTTEQKALVALEKFYAVLNDSGTQGLATGDYQEGYSAIKTLFGTAKPAGDIDTRARSIRTTSGGDISLAASGGAITMASNIYGNPLTPPGIVTEYGGTISTFTNGNVSIGQARIFTLRGGNLTMWSSNGNIAAGTAPRTVVTAPPTRVIIDVTSAAVETDLGGLATGGGIGVLASVAGVKPGNVGLYAPTGIVDAGDAGIRATGNITIGAVQVLNASNISAGGMSTGVAPAVSAPVITTSTTAAAASTAGGTALAKPETTSQAPADQNAAAEALSYITVEVLGYGGGDEDQDQDQDQKKKDKKP